MGIETIYYKMWDRETQCKLVEKAKFNDYAEIESREDVLKAVNIGVNNECFLERLRDNKTSGYDYCVQWLEGLMFEYVNRACKGIDDDSHVLYFFISWLNNTSFLIEGEYPKLAQWCEEQKKQITEFYEKKNDKRHNFNESRPKGQTEAAETHSQIKYSRELLDLFKNHTELIDELIGKSDDEIARQIKKWAKEKDNVGRALIENPKNNMRRTFARELKKNGLIKMSEDRFSRKLD